MEERYLLLEGGQQSAGYSLIPETRKEKGLEN